MHPTSIGPPVGRSKGIYVAILLVILFFASRSIASLVLNYKWWTEVDQVNTWMRTWLYRWAPAVAQWLLLYTIVWIAHARGLKYAGTGLRENSGYAKLTTLGFFGLALFLMAGAVDGWTVARYLGGHGVASSWNDPVFGKPLSFYFFDLPFYTNLASFLAVCAAAGAAVYYVTARVWQLKLRFPEMWRRGQIEWDDVKRLGTLETGFLKTLLGLFLVGLAVRFWLGRYNLLYSDHGQLMVGIDYVEQNVGLPLQYAKAAAALLAAALVMLGRRKLAMACAVVLLVDVALPPLVNSFYVRPNELALQRPYLERHIESTRAAFGLNQRSRDVEFAAHKSAPIDFGANNVMLDNVRLWEWQAFHDTLSQSQPLRPYAYADTDIDRYQIGGQMRQVMLAPRELDLTQLGSSQGWVITHTIYTHGYGLVLAEANRITSAGSPELLIRNAPVEVSAPGLKLARPEIYYGEEAHDPVFVRTAQPEFNYPSGSEDVNTRYDGHGGFPISSMPSKLVAAWAMGDWNIVLSNALTSESRMMMRRSIASRLDALAPFLMWDDDPYVVITDDGRLVWVIDGYTASDLHPYARGIRGRGFAEFNYIRNSVKATVDAYNGDVRLYIFDDQDPLIAGYEQLFPALFLPQSEMPADLRSHTRAPEFLFRTQAEIYRTYHMRVPESFYNRADFWDFATLSGGQGATPVPVAPTYLIATLPGETEPEFLLTIPFTPRNKQNLIGLMAARCDGEHLGELVFLQLPKQEIIPGPLQIEALINQDEVISKDLSLWNQQGSQVLRGQILVLPISNTFLFVAPIYIQAAQARMPQLEKVVLAAGEELIYADTYPQALEMLAARQAGTRSILTSNGPQPTNESAPGDSRQTDSRIRTIREHLDRYRSLTSQGKLSEAGRELEAIESLVK